MGESKLRRELANEEDHILYRNTVFKTNAT